MILLFGEKAQRSSKNSNIKSHPVENSGILAMGRGSIESLLNANEYDTYTFSTHPDIDYSMYNSEGSTNIAFMSDFSQGYSILGDSSCASFGPDCSCSFSSGDCGSFSSVC